MRVSHLTTFSPAQVYFIAEIVAYDISMICETAFNQKVAYQDQIVALLLEVDEVPDDKAQLETLRGVRKAQIKLATFYLAQGETERAVMIRQDMADEPPERLESIKEELESVQSATFWELEDRGYNFEYLTLDRKSKLQNFMHQNQQMNGVIQQQMIKQQQMYPELHGEDVTRNIMLAQAGIGGAGTGMGQGGGGKGGNGDEYQHYPAHWPRPRCPIPTE